ncbi:TrkA family potassium uptake protein [Haloarchaeobius sp. FL176]|uniref:potassium channel family protein n=1 Tax=Haloarchaeobius sp. FL176 TaxID=2967129 RepID=UPI00214865DD|nr:TrkA family potassium uptake protein [Haloarchaeobius sp. FL176]
MPQKRIAIAGGGRVGRRAANLLDDRGHDVVVIEDDPEQVGLLEEEHVATVISGDATRPSILSQVGLDRVDSLAALTDETGTNLAICMTAAHLRPNLRTVMRSEYDVGDEYDGMVDEVVFTEAAGARAAVNLIERDVQTLESVTGDLDILQIEVVEGAPVAGRTLEEVSLPRGSLVVSGADGDHTARSDTRLEVGETYIVAVEPAVANEVVNLFQT